MSQKLCESRKGWQLQYWEEGDRKKVTVPGLLYADDLVLMANDGKDLKQLLNISGRVATSLGRTFNQEKSAVLEIGDGEKTVEQYTVHC